MFRYKSRLASALVPTLFALVSGFGCMLQTSSAQTAPRKVEPDTFAASLAHRRKANAQLQSLWQQRGRKNIVRSILPFANDSTSDVQYNALKMLGRLEDPIALPTLQKLAKRPMHTPPLDAEPSEGLRDTYPALPLAIGRIKSRNLSGKRKIEVAIGELGLDFPALVRLSKRINRDQYADFRVGNTVILEVADILYQQKKRGVNVDALARSLTLRPAQRFLLSVAALPVKEQAKRMLSYLTQVPVRGGSRTDVFEHWEDLGRAGHVGAFPFVKGVLQRRTQKTSVYSMILVLQSLARNGNRDALSLLKSLSRDRDVRVRLMAQYYVETLK